MFITQLMPRWTRGLSAALVLAAGACSTGEDVRSSTSETTPATAATANTDEVVYRDLTAYEFSVCWQNADGSIMVPTSGAVPGPDAVIGNVRLYIPFGLDGGRRTDLDTFTRCEFVS